MHSIDNGLLHWDDVEKKYTWDAILIGNGASIAVSSSFSYSSLFEEASLTPHDRTVFDTLKTKDFEQILRALHVSSIVCAQVGHTDEAGARYTAIQDALINAVHKVHTDWLSIPSTTKHKIATSLRKFRHVFSTNYDLLVYWSAMDDGIYGFKDFFWNYGNTFNPQNTAAWLGSETLLYYLHGALHLTEGIDRVARKRVALFQNLLDNFGDPAEGIPLFVSEGSSEQKMRVIRSSDYLTHCYETLSRHAGGLVIFGNSLSDQDSHIANAILTHVERPVAVSIYPSTPEQVIQQKIQTQKVLSGARQIFYFDSRTHPLGDASLRVP